ncbi:hypothetical protein LUPAC07_06283 [Micromonospora noduli]|nr:hypothetical protein LUPAC07_06283 [Micromonospora noduli]
MPLAALTGAVVLLDLETPNFETVNATFAAFIEFLYRLGGFVATDLVKHGLRAAGTHQRLAPPGPIRPG